MNDRYLFRAKQIDTGEWYIGNLVDCPDGRNVIAEVGGNWALHEVDQSTICQCSGIPDKNRNAIWENDVVYMRCNGLSGFGKVIYENGCFWVDDKKRGRRYPFSNHDVKYRVDGNIFDNPELLEQEG